MPFRAHMQDNAYVTVWRKVGANSAGPTVSDVAEEIECGWEERSREVTGPDGQPVGVDVTLTGLTEELPVGSAVAKGRPHELLGSGQTPLGGVFKVVGSSREDDWRGRDADIEAYLTRWQDRLPPTGTV